MLFDIEVNQRKWEYDTFLENSELIITKWFILISLQVPTYVYVNTYIYIYIYLIYNSQEGLSNSASLLFYNYIFCVWIIL